MFLVALRQRFEFLEAFKRVDNNNDDRIDIDEFIQALDVIQKWVGPISDPEAEFEDIDRNGGGIILFDEFCGWALQKNLDLEDDDDFEYEPPRSSSKSINNYSNSILIFLLF